jgi:hypothetical protein
MHPAWSLVVDAIVYALACACARAHIPDASDANDSHLTCHGGHNTCISSPRHTHLRCLRMFNVVGRTADVNIAARMCTHITHSAPLPLSSLHGCSYSLRTWTATLRMSSQELSCTISLTSITHSLTFCARLSILVSTVHESPSLACIVHGWTLSTHARRNTNCHALSHSLRSLTHSLSALVFQPWRPQCTSRPRSLASHARIDSLHARTSHATRTLHPHTDMHMCARTRCTRCSRMSSLHVRKCGSAFTHSYAHVSCFAPHARSSSSKHTRTW